ncbi:MAG: DUF1624 domain-containing protein [Chloroflexi bacterium]|nr:DUF1624 domain-containing protein [Chloroflexota bacterium]
MPTDRISSIDQFRGFAILAMVLANFTGGMTVVPAWLKHAPDVGLTAIDLIAPFFIFAIGLTYGMSFRRRLDREPAAKTYGHFAVRYLAILGIGAIISAGETLIGENTSGVDWGVLQAIGMAGLLTLTVIRLPAPWRALIGLGLLAVYQVILDQFVLETVLRSSHGGLFGSLSWTAMLVLATALADLFHDPSKRKWFGAAGAAVLFTSLALALLVPVSKNRVSASYVLVSLGVSAVLFLVFHLFSERIRGGGRFLSAWGKNPLALYVLHYLLIGIVYLPNVPVLYAEAPPWLVLVECAALVGALSAAAYWMEKKKIILSL